ncbi:MAG TPA: FG-GAP-like repeat-containing protein, partial [Ilumatobacteraceae bacterium]|nr:FG-GAP-like repeat-containing protein [Ilumatobacteraceae bacterium]
MPDEPALAAHDGARRTWRWRSRWTVVATLAAVAIVGVGVALAMVAWRSGGSAANAGGVPHFVDDTTTAGIDHTYDGEFEFFVGGGVAAFDCDDDGRAELYFAGGSEPAALYRNESPLGGALHFSRQTSPVTDLTAVTGAYPLDIDGDAHVDLAVLRRGENVVLRGLGDCRFEDANELFGVDGGDAWTVAFSA